MSKNSWFGRITSEEGAKQEIKEVFYALLFMAGLRVLMDVVLSRFSLIGLLEALFVVIIAICIKQFHSRVAAIVLVVYTILQIVSTWIAFEETHQGFSWVLLFLLLWASTRAIEATFKLNGQFKSVSKV